MGLKYAVIGAGRQGTASAYDLVINGDADKVTLIDIDKSTAVESAALVNKLTGKNICVPVQADVRNKNEIAEILKDCNAAVSAVPYYYNYGITEAAIEAGCSLTDLGGHTGTVRKQLELSPKAEKKGIYIIPDCGMGPGMNVSLIELVVSSIEKPEHAIVYEGGLTQNPVPPWNFELTFHVNGLTNEYYGNALFLQEGKLTEVPCFEKYELIDFPEPLGKLEAAVTSGGLSTAPWTYQGRLLTLENKTLRYPGHWAQFKAFSDLGLFEESPVDFNGQKIIPREFYHKLIEPKITSEEIKDYAILRAVATGITQGKQVKVEADVIDKYDETTGFTGMQRLTGWHASIVAVLAAQGKIKHGANPIEKAVPGRVIMDEAKKRGIEVEERISFLN